jgi:Cu/Ag efflux protein CusF
MHLRSAPIRADLAGLALAVLLGLSACGDVDNQRGTGRGEVVAVDAVAGEITLDHGEIPGVMGAMKMSFPVSDPRLLEGVAPGQTVEFDVEYQGGMYTVKGLRPAGG